MKPEKKQSPGAQYGWDLECDCIGRMKPGDPYFLSREKEGERAEKSFFYNKKDQDRSSNASKPGSLKRSLKKIRQNPILSPQPKKDTNVQQQYYSPPHYIPIPPQHRLSRLIALKEPEVRAFSPRINFNFETSFTDRKPMIKVVSCQNLQNSNHSIKQFVYPPVAFNSKPPLLFTPPIPVKAKLEKDQQVVSPSVKVRQGECSISKKELQTEPHTVEQIDSPHHLNIPEESPQNHSNPLKTKRSVRSRKSQQISINYDLVDDEEVKPVLPEQIRAKPKKESAKSKIEKRNFNLPEFQGFRSKIESKKSKIGQIGKSKIGGKKHKDSKTSLKRINDVEQICSMIDSDEVQEQSEESVVLGRLRQYNQFGSAVEPSVSQTIPSTQSKVGYQSTTAEKSLLRAFESSHFR